VKNHCAKKVKGTVLHNFYCCYLNFLNFTEVRLSKSNSGKLVWLFQVFFGTIHSSNFARRVGIYDNKVWLKPVLPILIRTGITSHSNTFCIIREKWEEHVLVECLFKCKILWKKCQYLKTIIKSFQKLARKSFKCWQGKSFKCWRENPSNVGKENLPEAGALIICTNW